MISAHGRPALTCRYNSMQCTLISIPCMLSAIKDSFQKLSLIRSKIFEKAVSRTHYEIKT